MAIDRTIPEGAAVGGGDDLERRVAEALQKGRWMYAGLRAWTRAVAIDDVAPRIAAALRATRQVGFEEGVAATVAQHFGRPHPPSDDFAAGLAALERKS